MKPHCNPQRPTVNNRLPTRPHAAPTLVPEAMEAVKILNGIHWHGWRHAPAFRAWAEQFDLPQPTTPGNQPTVDDAKAQGWNGGRLIGELRRIVKARDSWLECPFLEP